VRCGTLARAEDRHCRRQATSLPIGTHRTVESRGGRCRLRWARPESNSSSLTSSAPTRHSSDAESPGTSRDERASVRSTFGLAGRSDIERVTTASPVGAENSVPCSPRVRGVHFLFHARARIPNRAQFGKSVWARPARRRVELALTAKTQGTATARTRSRSIRDWARADVAAAR
jgi:hypothetical protein